MFVSRGILTFAELLQKSVYRFTKRTESSSNSTIGACMVEFCMYVLVLYVNVVQLFFLYLESVPYYKFYNPYGQ